MNPDVPERERTPVPKRRWRPLDGPERNAHTWTAHSVYASGYEMHPETWDVWSAH